MLITVWKFLRKTARTVAVIIAFTLTLLIFYFVTQLVLAKVFPQSRLVRCGFLNNKGCSQRSDCYGYTVGGATAGGPTGYFCQSKSK